MCFLKYLLTVNDYILFNKEFSIGFVCDYNKLYSLFFINFLNKIIYVNWHYPLKLNNFCIYIGVISKENNLLIQDILIYFLYSK